MLQIPDNKKTRHLPDYMQEHLMTISPESAKLTITMFCLILLDMSAVPLLYPRNDLIYIVTIPLIIFIHLWLIRLLFKNPYTTQMETTLFMGVFSIVGAICNFITSIKVSYVFIGISNMWFYIVFSIVHLILIAVLVQFQIEKYSEINYKRNETNQWYNNTRFIPLLSAAPGIGYIIFQASKGSEKGMHSVFLIATIIFTLFLSYFAAKYIHKFFFMKTNMRLVFFNKPSDKSLLKAYERKGVVYK